MTTPPVLPYRGAEPGPRYPRGRGLLLGLLLGAVISAGIWFGLFHTRLLLRHDGWVMPAIFGVVGGKFIIAIATIIRSDRFRFAGIGLLLSIPMGTLIFAGACFSTL